MTGGWTMRRCLCILAWTGILWPQPPGAHPPSYPAGSEPACGAASRGSAVVSLGTPGNPDLLRVCARDALGRFRWVDAGAQDLATFAHTRVVAGCPMFPDDNIWNSRANVLPVDPDSAAIIASYRAARLAVSPSMPLNVADAATPAAPVAFQSRESDPGPYPLAAGMQVEGSSAAKPLPVSAGPYPGETALVVLRADECKLYEIHSLLTAQPPYRAGSGAVFDLARNDLRPDGWTSADAAGLPIWPGVLTYAELFGKGEIRHMIRFSVERTRAGYVWPARHFASRADSPWLPPMGSRWRLKAAFDGSVCRSGPRSGQEFPPEARRLIRALGSYGIILAHHGPALTLTADTDARWGDPRDAASPVAAVNQWLGCITGQDFEVAGDTPLMVSPDSAEALDPGEAVRRGAAESMSAAKPPADAAPAAESPGSESSAPVDYAFGQLAAGRPSQAAAAFTAANFPQEKQPPEVRQAYIETQLQLMLAAVKTKRCNNVEAAVDTFGAEDKTLPFTFGSFGSFVKQPRMQFYLGLVEAVCGDRKAAARRWSKVAKASAPLLSADFAFPVLAAAALNPAGAARSIEQALEQARAAAAPPQDKGLLLYSEGVLLRAAGRAEEAQQRFREGAASGRAFVRYLNGAARFDPPLPKM